MIAQLLALEENPWPGVILGVVTAATTCFILWLVLK